MIDYTCIHADFAVGEAIASKLDATPTAAQIDNWHYESNVLLIGILGNDLSSWWAIKIFIWRKVGVMKR